MPQSPIRASSVGPLLHWADLGTDSLKSRRLAVSAHRHSRGFKREPGVFSYVHQTRRSQKNIRMRFPGWIPAQEPCRNDGVGVHGKPVCPGRGDLQPEKAGLLAGRPISLRCRLYRANRRTLRSFGYCRRDRQSILSASHGLGFNLSQDFIYPVIPAALLSGNPAEAPGSRPRF